MSCHPKFGIARWFHGFRVDFDMHEEHLRNRSVVDKVSHSSTTNAVIVWLLWPHFRALRCFIHDA